MNEKHLASNWWKEATYISRYAGSGVINTTIGFIVIFSAMAMGFTPIVSNILGYAVGFMLGFVLSKKIVFRSNGHFVSESIRYLLAFVLSFLFNIFALQVALLLNVQIFMSQIIAATCYTSLMYILVRLFVFK